MPNRLANFFMKAAIRSPFHGILGPSFGVVMIRGRKSGRRISLPVNVIEQPDGSLLIVSMRNRTWWRNLQGGATAELRRAGRTVSVRTDVELEGGAVLHGLEDYFARYPGYAKYFDIPMDSGGKPDAARLREVAGERVLVRLYPAH
jgi:hypothetical protein